MPNDPTPGTNGNQDPNRNLHQAEADQDADQERKDEERQPERREAERSDHPKPTEPARQKRSNRGFAAMDPERQRAIASKGGQSQGKQNNPGNFANDRQKAREAGRKGGLA